MCPHNKAKSRYMETPTLSLGGCVSGERLLVVCNNAEMLLLFARV
jgi:hypothetical protein